MKFSQVARNKLFWGLDLINGSVIKKNVAEIKEGVENYSSRHSAHKRSETVSDLLAHASQTTSFYKKMHGRSIHEFPVINKNMIRQEYQAFRSSLFPDEKCSKVLTSGSTGAPLVVYQNKAKKYRNTADTIFFCRKSQFPGRAQVVLHATVERPSAEKQAESKDAEHGNGQCT